jgi:DNA-binding response OmpR family regulator
VAVGRRCATTDKTCESCPIYLESQTAEYSNAENRSCPKHALVADDDLLIRWSIYEALSEGGIDVTVAPDGDEAAEILAKESFDIVICDLKMPGRDGLSLTMDVRQRCPGAAVFLMTAFGSEETETTATEMGITYLRKPVDIEKLLKQIKEN